MELMSECVCMGTQRNGAHVREKKGLLFVFKWEISGCSTRTAMLDWAEVGCWTCNFKIQKSHFNQNVLFLAFWFVTDRH